MAVLFSTGLLFDFTGPTLICSGLTASSTGALLTSGKILSSAGLDIYGLKAIPEEVPVATREDLLGLFLLSSVTIKRVLVKL